MRAIHGTTGILVGPHGSLRAVSLRGATADGGAPLAISSIRPGDTLLLQNNHVVDRSQMVRTITGIVAQPAFNQGDPMTVQAGTSTLLVDMTSGIQIQAPAGSGLDLTTLTTADRVTIRGIVDTRLGEMTQPSAINVSPAA